MRSLLAITSVFLLFVFLAAKDTKANTSISTHDAIDICTRADMDWINFCNGLMQGYADLIYVTDPSCIPAGTTRIFLSEIFTGPAIYNTEAYKYNYPAIYGAMEVFGNTFQCNFDTY